jgi:hypothetical protein
MLSRENIEKTLKKKSGRRARRREKIKEVAGLSELFRYIYYRHHKIIIYYTMFLLCPIVCAERWGLRHQDKKKKAPAKKEEDETRRAKKRYDLSTAREMCRGLCVMQNGEPTSAYISSAPECLPEKWNEAAEERKKAPTERLDARYDTYCLLVFTHYGHSL